MGARKPKNSSQPVPFRRLAVYIPHRLNSSHRLWQEQKNIKRAEKKLKIILFSYCHFQNASVKMFSNRINGFYHLFEKGGILKMERKRSLIPVLVFIMLLGFVRVAKANFVQTLDEVSFYVVDDNTLPSGGNNSVDLAIPSIGLTGILQYSMNNSTWNNVTDSLLTIATGSDDWERVWFRLDLGGSYVTKGTLTFTGQDGDLWNAVAITWDNNGFTFGVPGDNDNVASVPIPAAVWLFGSGLFGLVPVRRKRNNIS